MNITQKEIDDLRSTICLAKSCLVNVNDTLNNIEDRWNKMSLHNSEAD